MSEIVYTAQASVTGGRRGGHGETSDGNLSVALETPGTGGSATNPEQLFAVGYAACFSSAVAFTAMRQKVDTGPVAIASSVSLLKGEQGAFDLAVELRVTLPALDEDAAADLVRTAHGTCPYSRATRGNIEVALVANGRPV